MLSKCHKGLEYKFSATFLQLGLRRSSLVVSTKQRKMASDLPQYACANKISCAVLSIVRFTLRTGDLTFCLLLRLPTNKFFDWFFFYTRSSVFVCMLISETMFTKSTFYSISQRDSCLFFLFRGASFFFQFDYAVDRELKDNLYLLKCVKPFL